MRLSPLSLFLILAVVGAQDAPAGTESLSNPAGTDTTPVPPPPPAGSGDPTAETPAATATTDSEAPGAPTETTGAPTGPTDAAPTDAPGAPTEGAPTVTDASTDGAPPTDTAAPTDSAPPTEPVTPTMVPTTGTARPPPIDTGAPTDSAPTETGAPTEPAPPDVPPTGTDGSGPPVAPTESAPAPPGPPVDLNGQSGQTTPEGYAPGSGPGCEHCTLPPGYTNLDIAAPLGVQNQFTPRWQSAHAAAAAALQGWSVEDKVNLATGVGWMVGRCVGNTPALPQHGWKGLCLQDSPLGVRFVDRVTAWPAGINAAATFDKSLIYARGKGMGEEFKGKGIHIALGPMTNMGRVAAGGRNWEGFGGDPYLSGHGTQYTIWGMQDVGVQAVVKHFIANEQERNRTTSSSNIDDRTTREIYGHPFLRAVQADVAAVMCSYNLVNGSWACQNPQMQNGLLKTDFGFGGYIMSDWNGQHSGVLSANTGLDMTMPGDIDMDGGNTTYWGEHLVEAVNNGSVAPARLDDMAERIMAAYYLTGQDKGYPEVNFNSWTPDGPENEHVDVQGNHAELVRQIGAASTVLLKNEKNALPLQKPISMAVIGSDMGPSQGGPNGCPDHGCLNGTLAMGWGSGTTLFPYLIDPLSALVARAKADHTSINWSLRDWDNTTAVTIAQSADVAIVGIASDSGEEYITVDGNVGDRNNLTAWNNGDELVKAVAAVNNNTIVVVHSVGPMTVEEWIEHPNITAVVWAGLPGQESGNSLVDVLYGAVNPSGRLPYTIAKQDADYPTSIDYLSTDTPKEPQVNYDEKLNIDYRHFLANGIEPRFGFGFGLSYSSFAYANLAVEAYTPDGGNRKRDARHVKRRQPSLADGNALEARTNGGGHGGGHGGHGEPPRVGAHNTPELHKPRYSVSIQVSNTGGVDGHDTPQLYLVFPEGSGEPPRVFRDFERVFVKCDATVTVKYTLSKYDLSIWDVVKQEWVIPQGAFGAVVAKNAFDEGVRCDFTPEC